MNATTLLLPLVRIFFAATLIVAGTTKILHRRDFGATLSGLGLFPSVSRFIAFGFPLVEIAIALGLLCGRLVAWYAAVSLCVLSMTITVVIVGAIYFSRYPLCSCFGPLSSEPVGPRHLGTTAIVIFGSIAMALEPLQSFEPLIGLNKTNLLPIFVLIAACLGILHALLRGNWHQRRQQFVDDALDRLNGPLLPGTSIPEFMLPNVAGTLTPVRELLQPNKRLLLLFVNPSCAHCKAAKFLLQESFGALYQQTTIALVAHGKTDKARKAFGTTFPILLDEDNTVSKLFQCNRSPAMISIDENGLVVTTLVSGYPEIQRVVQAMQQTTRTTTEP